MPGDLDGLIDHILSGYQLPAFGIHGIPHWARVLENGLAIADQTGADRDVITLFAIFHDARRVNENHDPGHGSRGAELARSLVGDAWVDDHRLELLVHACVHHTDGLVEGDITVQACWDADRLDLPRVGITPRPDRLCTDAGRSLVSWARSRAIDHHEPAIVRAWARVASRRRA